MHEILKKDIGLIANKCINYTCNYLNINYFKDFKYFYSLPKTFKDSNVLLVLDSFDYSEQMMKKTFIIGNLQEKFKPMFFCVAYAYNEKYYSIIDDYLLHDLSFKAYPTKKFVLEQLLYDVLYDMRSSVNKRFYYDLNLIDRDIFVGTANEVLNEPANIFVDAVNEVLNELEDNFEQEIKIIYDKINDDFMLKLKNSSLLTQTIFAETLIK